MPDVIRHDNIWHRFVIVVEFRKLFYSMPTHEFYSWKTKLGRRIQRELDLQAFKSATGRSLGGFITNPQASGLYVCFFWRGHREESFFDLYWNCLWEVTQRIIIPSVIRLGYKPWDIEINISVQDHENNHSETTCIYPVKEN